MSQETFNSGCFIQGSRLVVNGRYYLADLNGNIKTVNDSDELARFRDTSTNLVHFQIIELAFDGTGDGIGPVTIRLDPDRTPPPTTLTAYSSGFPAVHDFNMNINVTIPDLLPGITLRNKIPTDYGAPTILRASLGQFPPNSDGYIPAEPVELEDVNNPGPVLAEISTLPTTLSPA